MAPIKYTTMPPIKAGEQMDLFQQQSLSAITSMAQASSTATEFGYPQIAQAAERVQFTFINKIYNTTVNIISRETEDELKGRVTDLQNTTAEQLPTQQQAEPRTQTFKCLKDFEDCKARNPDGYKMCYAALVACVGANVAQAITGGGGD
jgi:hypothetical protein